MSDRWCEGEPARRCDCWMDDEPACYYGRPLPDDLLDGLRPDSIAHSDQKRETFQERYDAARWRLHQEQEASGLEVSISVRDNYRDQQFAADQRARIAQRHPPAGHRDGHPSWAVRRVEDGLGS